MRDINDLTHEEIIALTDEQVNRMYDWICAEKGIRFVEFPKEPEKEVFEPDDLVYQVNDFYTQDSAFAAELSKFLADNFNKFVKTNYNYRVGSDYYYVEKNLNEYDLKTEIKPKKVFKPETYEKLSAAMTKFKERKDEYDQQKRDYDKYREARGKAVNEISWVISAHMRLEAKLIEYRSLFNRYMELAENNKEVALRFFKKALGEKEWGPVEDWVLHKLGFVEAVPDGFNFEELEAQAVRSLGDF